MTRRLLTLLPALWGALDLGAAARAHAAPAPCPAVVVEAEGGTLDRWPALAEQIRQAFAGREDVDRCARVRLHGIAGAIEVQVVLPDGRSTSRLVAPEDVLPRLEALLLVPAPAAPPSPPAAPAARPTTTHFEAAAIEVRVEPARPLRHFAAELSLAASLRGGDGQTSTGVGATALLEAAGWLAGFGARIDGYQAAAGASADAPTALEVGVLVGRRFRSGRLSFDLAGGPVAALRGSWEVMTANGAASGSVRSSSADSTLVPRCLVGGRLTLGARSTLRTFLAFEAEMGAAGPIPPGEVRGLPAWSLGGALGVTVGTL